jgi:hypothetical protein
MDADETRRALHGQALRWPDAPLEEGQYAQMLDEHGELVAVGVYTAATNGLRPRFVLA